MDRARSAMGRAIGCAAVLTLSAPAGAEVVWSVTFANAQNIGSWVPSISAALLGAGAEWSRYLVSDARLDVQVVIDPTISRATGRSVTSNYLFHNGEMQVWDQGAAAEIRSGIDPNGLTADIEIRLSPSYLANELWFDPDPWDRTAAVPTNRTDAVSVFLHEIGHAIGFNGWRDDVTGTTPGYGSQFDALTVFDGSDFFFAGPRSVEEYGSPVPLTRGNIFHLGNNSPAPGYDLRDDLMNGVVFKRGHRYDVSRLNVAMLADLGIEVELPDVPAPGTVVIVSAAGLMAMRRRR